MSIQFLKSTSLNSYRFFLFSGLILFLSACTSVEAPKASPSPTKIQAFTSTPSPKPTTTPSPTASATSLPPADFESNILREGVEGRNYIEDQCEYLAMRWGTDKSLPGTIVVPIFFHSIRPGGEEVSDPSFINKDHFDAIIQRAIDLGFETITSDELIGFLYGNERIPPRSMMLILDDRRPGTAEDYFLPVLRENDWTATLAWLVGDSDQRTGLWEWIQRLNKSGFFDMQAHGLNHIYLSEESSEEDTREEIFGTIPIFREKFGYRPSAFIWPGGNYTHLGIEIAREAGFKLGFTVHSRGPLLFNWIPQGEKEALYADALMLLPRFWSSAALLNIEQSIEIGDQARAFAMQFYDEEADWYRSTCGGELSPLSEILPTN